MSVLSLHLCPMDLMSFPLYSQTLIKPWSHIRLLTCGTSCVGGGGLPSPRTGSLGQPGVPHWGAQGLRTNAPKRGLALVPGPLTCRATRGVPELRPTPDPRRQGLRNTLTTRHCPLHNTTHPHFTALLLQQLIHGLLGFYNCRFMEY